jgi:hypothetical protein
VAGGQVVVDERRLASADLPAALAAVRALAPRVAQVAAALPPPQAGAAAGAPSRERG